MEDRISETNPKNWGLACDEFRTYLFALAPNYCTNLPTINNGIISLDNGIIVGYAFIFS